MTAVVVAVPSARMLGSSPLGTPKDWARVPSMTPTLPMMFPPRGAASSPGARDKACIVAVPYQQRRCRELQDLRFGEAPLREIVAERVRDDLARGDTNTRAAVARSVRRKYTIVVPTPVIAQVHRGFHYRARVDRVLKSVDRFLPTMVLTAHRAGELLGRTGTSDVVDVIVAADAITGAPASILTSDPGDLRSLVNAETTQDRVSVIGI